MCTIRFQQSSTRHDCGTCARDILYFLFCIIFLTQRLTPKTCHSKLSLVWHSALRKEDIEIINYAIQSAVSSFLFLLPEITAVSQFSSSVAVTSSSIASHLAKFTLMAYVGIVFCGICCILVVIYLSTAFLLDLS